MDKGESIMNKAQKQFWYNHFFNTLYAIRDVWTYKQLIELRRVLDDIIEDKENGGYTDV